VIGIDAGLLAWAANRHVPEHARAAAALEALASGDRPWGLPASEAHAFLRLVTHPHRVGRPLAHAEAMGFLDALLSAPSGRWLLPTPGHAWAVRETLAFLAPHEPVPAVLETVAILREHGVRDVLACETALRRFPFLEVRDPVHGPAWSPHEPPARRYRVLTPRPPRG
jgi:predicted nucleic acid-binding protein